ncbi:DUF4381 family protein [Shewanella sp. KX20019]|uniref:DUF4381 family protein n=1 Tax=Shewanella sp. KX20019 TaxID=2803864 RepID=UPI00192719A6|nr:DUF4381 family protein [Shewanella sp. KX20019]QQX78369.1 DUF4381 family protein [Shewanella sp. KX20019]
MSTENQLNRVIEQNDFTFGNPVLQLNEFIGISQPKMTAFFPQTWGWWLLLLLTTLFVSRFSYQRVRYWYSNRYRKQAVKRILSYKNQPLERFSLLLLQEIKLAIATAYGSDTEIDLSRLTLSKQALLNPALSKRGVNATAPIYSAFGGNANKSVIVTLAAIEGQALLLLLDLTAEHQCAFNTSLGDAWLQSLLSKIDDKQAAVAMQGNLIDQSCIWLMHHTAALPIALQISMAERADA